MLTSWLPECYHDMERDVMAHKLTLVLLIATSLPFAAGAVSGPGSSGEEWIGKPAPEIASGNWINSSPLTISELKGKVVLLEFWTFGCYNCRNTLPHVKEWYKNFPREQLQVIGVHTPEFDREKLLTNVQRSVKDLGIEYSVVTDNEYATWEAYNQRYWPVMYVIDKKGIIRDVQIGEGGYTRIEDLLRELIKEK